jgi:hypothetical protein
MRGIKPILLIVTPFLGARSFGHLGATILESTVTCMDQVCQLKRAG